IIAVLALVSIALFFVVGKKKKYILNILIFFITSSIYILSVEYLFNNVLKPHQRGRIEVILGKLDDPRGEGYQLTQSKIAIGSGQLFGKGYLQGTQTKYNFVPEQSTDFIICTVAEEWGFVGTTFLILIYITLLLRIVHIAERQRTVFARSYAYGVAVIL